MFLLWKTVAGEADAGKDQSSYSEHVTGSSNDELAANDSDDEVVVGHASVSMATPDASSASASRLLDAFTVELQQPLAWLCLPCMMS